MCFVPVFDEADILPWTLAAMKREGCEVWVLDGWSRDGSWEIAQELADRAERFPAEGDDGIWSLIRTLSYIEQLALDSGADWCVLSDADEIRRSPIPGERLIDRVEKISDAGYNVIDFEVMSFQPVDDSYKGDPENYFCYLTDDPEVDGVLRLPQEKLWKNDDLVNIHSSGGHILYRAAKNICPEKLLMMHYPFRTMAQAQRKLSSRLERRDPQEHAVGFGVHYDKIDLAEIIRPVETLKPYQLSS
jgi:hypothetical protein